MAAHNSRRPASSCRSSASPSAARSNPRQVKIPGILVDCVVRRRAARGPHADLRRALHRRLRRRDPRADEHARSRWRWTSARSSRGARRSSCEANARRQPRHRHARGRRRGGRRGEASPTCVTLTAEPGVIGGVPAARPRLRRRDQRAGDHRPALAVRLLRRRRARPAPSSAWPRSTGTATSTSARFGPRLAGAGGFINISQSAKAVVFVGTFTAGALEVAGARTARCASSREGNVAQVRRARSSTAPSRAPTPLKRGQPVLYVTERCVFRLTPAGLELIEVAPGIDIERDILAHMDFAPIVARPAADGRAHLRAPSRWACASACWRCRSSSASATTPSCRMLFIDFRQLTIASERDIERIKAEVERRVRPLGHKVYAIVNYRGCRIEPAVPTSYRRMVEALEEQLLPGRHALRPVRRPGAGHGQEQRRPGAIPDARASLSRTR